MIKAEIISIGDELLNGQTVNTNASWIAKKLSNIGIKNHYTTTIGDLKSDIKESLDLALDRVDVILITGGLGPTKDDITKHTLAEHFNTSLVENQTILERLEGFYTARGRELNELNKTQALLPREAKVIDNLIGTASGMWFEDKGKVIISMPGVPREMKKMMEDTILPNLLKFFNSAKIEHYFLKTIGIPESDLAIILQNWESNLPSALKIAYLPSLGMVKLRLTKVEPISPEKVQEEILKAKKLISKYIYSEQEEETIEEAVGQLLKESNFTISTAESCTGGYLAHLLTSVSGSSNYYQGSTISYSNEVKEKELGVPQDILSKFGAVSQEVVEQMAKAAKNKYKTTFALATSGIAGPEGGTDEKPVGTIWIAIAYNNSVKSKLLKLNQPRKANIHLTAITCLNLLRQTINSGLS